MYDMEVFVPLRGLPPLCRSNRPGETRSAKFCSVTWGRKTGARNVEVARTLRAETGMPVVVHVVDGRCASLARQAGLDGFLAVRGDEAEAEAERTGETVARECEVSGVSEGGIRTGGARLCVKASIRSYARCAG